MVSIFPPLQTPLCPCHASNCSSYWSKSRLSECWGCAWARCPSHPQETDTENSKNWKQGVHFPHLLLPIPPSHAPFPCPHPPPPSFFVLVEGVVGWLYSRHCSLIRMMKTTPTPMCTILPFPHGLPLPSSLPHQALLSLQGRGLWIALLLLPSPPNLEGEMERRRFGVGRRREGGCGKEGVGVKCRDKREGLA